MTTTISAPAASGRGTKAAGAVLGLDLSLTGTGVAGNGWADTIKPPAKLRGLERMEHIRTTLLDSYLTDVALVVIEGPSYGSQTAGQRGHHERAGLWWMVRRALWRRDVPVAITPPSCLKRYATGRGNAGKDDIMREVARRFAWFNGDNNAADALILAALGADHAGAPMVDMPKAHRMALEGVEWPEVAS